MGKFASPERIIAQLVGHKDFLKEIVIGFGASLNPLQTWHFHCKFEESLQRTERRGPISILREFFFELL
jgi:hypothetical protein